MARYTGAVCRLCRRENKKLFLKGERCYTDKCAVSRRASVPGQHGKARARKSSEYGIQLRAKQQTRRYYGILESQFAKYFDMAARKEGVTGENLLQICESRLDNVVYRLGFASSRKEARQLVLHGHFTVNGKKANIPSILLKAGDVVAVASKSDKIKNVVETMASRPVAKWLDCNKTNMTGRVIDLPKREDIDLDVEEHLIVELYSK
ncbi:30S ribosomal protein S4 [Marasmitruncus massiliensis]|jgi:small subunit ribosomal protein S4|uniref:30S ribosomal protein S4 n=1 Tax=Marasmitruncus massiliensis TaxID=1944642 RepID=UPI000C79DC3F|nr:30S ribosomal protein S4 [Marasmitruncus massiliensis]MBE6905441.1 30S ribosomal protein S4 [Oscillospiraceae bacterium]